MASSNYAYAATRARVRRSKLLKAEAYRHLMALEPVEIARYIQELDYRTEVDKYGAQYKGTDLIEVALASNLRRNSAQIQSFCKGQLKELVGYYVERYRVRDLKRVIRGLYSGQSPERILRGMFTTTPRNREFFAKLANAASLAELAELLEGSPYHNVLGDGLKDEKLASLQPLEDALDRFYYQKLLETVTPDSAPNKLLLAFIRREIDVVNLQTVARLRHRGITGYAELLIPGGAELPVERLAATATVSEVANAVEATDIGKAVAEELAGVTTEGLNPLARVLDHYLAEGARRFTRLYPLSVLPVLDYLLHKEYEVANLQALARGKELGLANAQIEELLVVH